MPALPSAPDAKDSEQISFAVDSLDYDGKTEVARGDVRMIRGAMRMRADKLIWNRRTGKVLGEGNVVISNPDGDNTYGDSIELTDRLRDGIIENLLVVLGNGSRLAAVPARPSSMAISRSKMRSTRLARSTIATAARSQ